MGVLIKEFQRFPQPTRFPDSLDGGSPTCVRTFWFSSCTWAQNTGGPRVIRNQFLNHYPCRSGLHHASSVVGTHTYVLSSLGRLYNLI